MKKIIRIAVDGPGGAGKSTIAKAIAKRFNIDYIDTGAMYRAVGYKLIKKNVSTEDIAGVKAILDKTDIDFVNGDIILDGAVVNDRIRTTDISMMASKCSALQPVREKLVELQRNMGKTKSVIMDGRDIGTNVLKDAEYKFFLTASPEERAERRFKELKEKGEQVSYEDILKEMNQRDYNDMTRKLNPLIKADDAIEIDTTGKSIEEVISIILREVK